jgi:hypothetical protein
MACRGIVSLALRALLVFTWADVTISQSQEAEQSVGKVRSSAEVAFSNGEIDQALKLWGKVDVLCKSDIMHVFSPYYFRMCFILIFVANLL